MSPLEPMESNSGTFTGGIWDVAYTFSYKWCDAMVEEPLRTEAS